MGQVKKCLVELIESVEPSKSISPIVILSRIETLCKASLEIPENLALYRRFKHFIRFDDHMSHVICANLEFVRFGVMEGRANRDGSEGNEEFTHPVEIQRFLNKHGFPYSMLNRTRSEVLDASAEIDKELDATEFDSVDEIPVTPVEDRGVASNTMKMCFVDVYCLAQSLAIGAKSRFLSDIASALLYARTLYSHQFSLYVNRKQREREMYINAKNEAREELNDTLDKLIDTNEEIERVRRAIDSINVTELERQGQAEKDAQDREYNALVDKLRVMELNIELTKANTEKLKEQHLKDEAELAELDHQIYLSEKLEAMGGIEEAKRRSKRMYELIDLLEKYEFHEMDPLLVAEIMQFYEDMLEEEKQDAERAEADRQQRLLEYNQVDEVSDDEDDW